MKVLPRVWVHIVVDVSFCSANASHQMITGSASERAPEESSHSHHRFIPRVHGGRNHQLGAGHRPLLDPQLHQQVRSQACTLSLRKLLWLFVTYCARRNRSDMSDWFQKFLNFNIKTLLCPRLLKESYSTTDSFVAVTHENAIDSLMPRSYIWSFLFG